MEASDTKRPATEGADEQHRSRPKRLAPDMEAPVAREGPDDEGSHEVLPPGERVDDEVTSGKVMKRQE